MASYLGLRQVVEDILLEAKIDINTKGGFHGTALQTAAGKGHKEIVELLLDRGANVDVNSKGVYYGTVLQAAAGEGYKEIVELLLDRGVDVNVNVEDRHYGTGVCKQLQAEVIRRLSELLLDHRADVEIENSRCTALQAAAGGGYKEIVELLLDSRLPTSTSKASAVRRCK